MQSVYYRERSGCEPVREFLQALDASGREAVAWAVELLNAMGVNDPPLPFPYSSQVVGELRELRCHAGRRHVRVLYRRSERLFVLLHAFEKRSAQAAGRRVTDLYTEREPYAARCGPKIPAGTNVTWSFRWNPKSVRATSNEALKTAVDGLFNG